MCSVVRCKTMFPRFLEYCFNYRDGNRFVELNPERIRIKLDSCEIANKDQPPLHTYLEENITSEQLISLRQHLEHDFYPLSQDFPINTIKHGIFPSGGAAHALVHALGECAGGVRWPACEAELKSVGVC